MHSYLIFFTHFPQALTLCLEASGWCEFAHGQSLRSDTLICLSFWPFDYIYYSPSLSLSFPSSYSTLWVETVEPICYDDTFTGCPGWTTTQDPGLPKTVTLFKAANKLAANYLSNTCWWRCLESPLTKEQLVKETRRGISIWPEITT